MMNSSFSLILYVSILGAISMSLACNSQTKFDSQQASIEKNNQSAEYFFNRFHDENYVNRAFELAYEAINLDSLNADAYSNLAMYYDWKGETDKSIHIIDIAIDKIDSYKTASLYIQKGLYLFRIDGISDETRQAFEMARNLYTDKINNAENIDKDIIKSEIAFTYLFTHTSDRAVNEIDKVLTIYPDSEFAKEYKVIIKNFFNDLKSSP